MTSPAYLREIARTYERAGEKATGPARAKHLDTARRLHEIAVELDEVLGRMKTDAAPVYPPRDLSRGVDIALERNRRAAAAAPTPDEMAAIRGLVGEHRRTP